MRNFLPKNAPCATIFLLGEQILVKLPPVVSTYLRFLLFSGLTKERGLTQFELYSAKKQIFKKDLEIFLKNPFDDATKQDLFARYQFHQHFMHKLNVPKCHVHRFMIYV